MEENKMITNISDPNIKTCSTCQYSFVNSKSDFFRCNICGFCFNIKIIDDFNCKKYERWSFL